MCHHIRTGVRLPLRPKCHGMERERKKKRVEEGEERRGRAERRGERRTKLILNRTTPVPIAVQFRMRDTKIAMEVNLSN